MENIFCYRNLFYKPQFLITFSVAKNERNPMYVTFC